MKISSLNFDGVFLIELNPIIDSRGFFMRTYDEKIFQDAGIIFNWVQENHSKSINKGTIRGLHLQLPPYQETKLVRCIKGSIQDVFVDLRKSSSTFGQWGSIVLSENNFKCILIPRGFAHGFCTLIDNCEVVYKVDNYYAPEYEVGIIWYDIDLGIKWDVNKPILSEKDKKNITFKEFVEKYKGL